MNPITASMSPLLLLLLLRICSSAFAHPVTLPIPSPTTPTSAYDILKSYNFPIGLLPIGATGFDFNSDSGKFSVYFDGTCSFNLEGSYQLRYQSTISGQISNGRLRDLKGISVKVLFFWVNIVEVDRVGDNLDFSVGIASADFPTNNFDECPQCGCGMDCHHLKLRSSF